MNIELFRGHFPVFVDPTCYPDTEIEFWASLAEKLHDRGRWGELLETGIELFVAHHLAVESASRGQQIPGQIVGPVTSASVDKVSYSRDASSATDPKNGHWNLTTYGLRWRQLARMIGAGPVMVGAPAESQTRSMAWPGVIPPII